MEEVTAFRSKFCSIAITVVCRISENPGRIEFIVVIRIFGFSEDPIRL